MYTGCAWRADLCADMLNALCVAFVEFFALFADSSAVSNRPIAELRTRTLRDNVHQLLYENHASQLKNRLGT